MAVPVHYLHGAGKKERRDRGICCRCGARRRCRPAGTATATGSGAGLWAEAWAWGSPGPGIAVKPAIAGRGGFQIQSSENIWRKAHGKSALRTLRYYKRRQTLFFIRGPSGHALVLSPSRQIRGANKVPPRPLGIRHSGSLYGT